MKKILRGWLVQPISRYRISDDVTWMNVRPSPDSEFYRAIAPQDIEVDVPEGYNPTALRVTALKEEQARLRAQFVERFNALEDEVSKLQALSFEAPA